ncbi:MAG: prepilin-type N-terminal cleavage/methylation domain-containing protein [Planctomycetota bacterium]
MKARSGFTLVELLIALTIASVLTVIALPTLKDSFRQNSLARSASLVKGAFINARAQAIRTGRPYGIVLERQQRDLGTGQPVDLDFLRANYCTRMYYVQSPLEYRGDVIPSYIYPVFEAIPLAGGNFNYMPYFFIPQSSSGLVFASANDVGSPARRLINIGTKFSVADSDYVFEVTDLTTIAAASNPILANSEPGTRIDFMVFDQGSGLYPIATSQQFDFTPEDGLWNLAVGESPVFPNGLAEFQPHSFSFQTNPIRAPLAPVALPGRTVVDLSVSGPSNDPLRFNAQDIVDANVTVAPPNVLANARLNDVVVMFAPDGRLDGVFSDERVLAGADLTSFAVTRVDPSTSVSFCVGFVDGILDNVDDGARFPNLVAGTDFSVHPGDLALSETDTTVAFEPPKPPNFANTDCAWISVQPSSGSIRLDTVASQPLGNRLTNYYGFGTAPTARSLMNARVRQSRRLATSGTVK